VDRSDVVSRTPTHRGSPDVRDRRDGHRCCQALGAAFLLAAIACTTERSGNPPATQAESAAAPGGEATGATAGSPAAPTTRGTLFVSNEGGNSLSVVDAATDSVVATIDVGNRPRGMAVSPDSKTVYVALGRENAVAVVDVASRAVTAKIPANADPEQVAISPDGKTLYVSNEDPDRKSVV
jgi:YVTN family beta-propeller protein